VNERPQFPTPIQDIALNLIFAAMREGRINRTYDEYMAIAAKLLPLKVLTSKINRFLREIHKCNGSGGVLLPQLCRFKGGDERVIYEPYPQRISYETVRKALDVARMRQPRWRKGNTF
jgi:hypothetical protein